MPLVNQKISPQRQLQTIRKKRLLEQSLLLFFILKSVFEILICLIEGANWVVGKDPVFGNKGCDQGV